MEDRRRGGGRVKGSEREEKRKGGEREKRRMKNGRVGKEIKLVATL